MAGIYIHIPFCKKACHYCNFHFSTSLNLIHDFTSALLKEIKLRKEYTGNEIVETIYFGGGTPSLLSGEALQTLLAAIYKHYTVSDDVEITLEANPDDIGAQQLGSWRQAGINRLSMGVQSFFEEDLQWMNRAHNAEQAISSIRLAQQHGFENLTIDLIYGGPALTDDKWLHNIEQAVALNIPHLSCYALTVEPGTALDTMIRRQQKPDVIPDDQARQFLLLVNQLEQAGYEQYEISNFARPGHRSRHNSSYWQGKSYLGLGPSAHSFNGSSRQWNVANNALYIKALEQDRLEAEIETLTIAQQQNEHIMIALRTMEGVDLKKIEERFGEKESARLKNLADKYIKSGKLTVTSNTLQLTKAGKLFADGIAADLFI